MNHYSVRSVNLADSITITTYRINNNQVDLEKTLVEMLHKIMDKAQL